MRLSLGGLLAGLVLLLNALSASPDLHEWFHADAGDAGHECAVTLFAHGQMDSGSVNTSAVAPSLPCEIVFSVHSSIFASVIDQLPAGRAPPVSDSSLI